MHHLEDKDERHRFVESGSWTRRSGWPFLDAVRCSRQLSLDWTRRNSPAIYGAFWNLPALLTDGIEIVFDQSKEADFLILRDFAR